MPFFREYRNFDYSHEKNEKVRQHEEMDERYFITEVLMSCKTAAVGVTLWNA